MFSGLFGKPKVTAAAKVAIDKFTTTLELIKAEPGCSEYTKTVIDQVKTKIVEMEGDPKKVIDLTNLFDQDAVHMLLNDKQFARVAEELTNFIEKNPPDKLWDAAVIKASFAIIKSTWATAIANLKLTQQLCLLIAKSDQFSEKFSPDEKQKDAKPFIDELKEPFAGTAKIYDEVRKSVAEYKKQLRSASADAKKTSDQLTAGITKLKEMQQRYPIDLANFLQSKWFDVNVLPYYYLRGILPVTLTQNIDHSEKWGIDHISMFPCRANIFSYILEFEYDMTEAAKAFKQPAPATPFHAHIQKKIKAEGKETAAFVANVNKQLVELKKEVDGYVVKAGTDPEKVKIIQGLKEDLAISLDPKKADDVARKIKYTFKALMRACIWHSKVLSESVAAKKPLSPGRLGEIIKKYYPVLFNAYFSLNEANSNSYYYTDFVAIAEAKQAAANMGAAGAVAGAAGGSGSGTAIPADLPRQDPNVPAEFERFQMAYALLCPTAKPQKQAGTAAAPAAKKG